MLAIADEERPKDEVFITSSGGIQNEIIKEESRGQIGTIDRT